MNTYIYIYIPLIHNARFHEINSLLHSIATAISDTIPTTIATAIASNLTLKLDAMTREEERVSVINIHQATARRPDLETRVNTHIKAEVNQSEGRRRIRYHS